MGHVVLLVSERGSWVVGTTCNLEEPSPGPHGDKQGVMSV